MNGLTLVVGFACILIIAYRLYGGFMAAKVLSVDATRPTPAHTMENGTDYVPMNRWVAFGHHFAAIAAAGPLVGPILAAQFGYLPGTIWLLVGAVLGGAVHDMVVLFASIRHKGKSLSDIAREEVGPIAGVCTGIAILFIITITMAGLSLVVVHALKNNAWGTFTVGATIPIAIFIGILIKLYPNKLGWWTALGMALVIAAVALGPSVKGTWLGSILTLSEQGVKLALPIYAFFAAALPVWFLLAPRDYLSSYMKIGTIGALAIGIILIHPDLRMPALTPFINGGGPVIKGPVWPFVSITIACGAISGFHALIGSGTTPKMIDNEKDIQLVGFGGMLVETFVGVMALIAACVLEPGDYFAINSAPAVFANLNIPVVHLPELSSLVGIDLAGRTGGAVSLAVGMAYIFNQLPGMTGLMAYWYEFAILFEAVFILTAIDAGTRVARYIVQDFFGQVIPKLKDNDWKPGVIGVSAIVSAAWGYLLYGGDIASVWPLFGVSNQLLATLALAIGTSLILKKTGKIRYALTCFLPMSYLFVTVMYAGYWTIINQYLPKGMMLNTVLSVIMMGLAVIIMGDALIKWYTIITNNHHHNTHHDHDKHVTKPV
ncbi:carbon starvation CstA family protein [Heliophilum fasciatum]|uniref:Carbon starvation protein n=1 Tax=Heliophilum fasciatum TaxID=35700 RepID=A0A4R2RWY6_9FIRM|nr:carbon starvation protein A [Heliophilum fasciatum]MCW2276635.1 carbon starvation protein [Heliophilum fasciatum]TCP68982.1 carbon starvation protein [Heliophilum fasciatum]